MTQIIIPKGLYSDGFSNAILRKFRCSLLANLNLQELLRMKTAIQENLFTNYPELSLNVRILSNLLIKNFVLVKTVGTDYIRINHFAVYPGTNVRLVDILNFINSGSLEIRGYPIFRDVSNFINDNLDKYYARYVHGGGIV